MRFIKIFLKFLLLIIILALGAYFSFQEGSIFWAKNMLKQDISYLQRTNQWVDASNQCLEKTGEAASRLQLRFLDNKRYQLEVACVNEKYIPLKPTKQLPTLVKKTTGWSGFKVSLQPRYVSGSVTLQIWGRSTTLTGEGEDIVSKIGTTTDSSTLLITSCEAHGLSCCDPLYEAGQGNQMINGVNDCNQSCFSSCVRRPNLILFQSDPAMNIATRQVNLDKSNTFVLFNYSFEENDNHLQEIIIDFGDGTTEQLSSESWGKVTKQYSCNQPECNYTATIKAIDSQGIESATMPLSKINIVIR